jgi:hypothetical protein
MIRTTRRANPSMANLFNGMPFKRMLYATALLASLLTGACGAGANGDRMKDDAKFDVAWQAVRDAATADAQRKGIDAFLELNQQAGAPPLMVNVTRRDSGEKAAIDQALWDNPQQYEVTLRYGDRRYGFTPLSRSSLEPLFRE